MMRDRDGPSLSSRLQMSRSVRIVALQINLCCKVFRSDIELVQLHSRMASAENFTGFICSVVPEIRRTGGAGRHLFDLLSPSSEGHPCGEPCPVEHG